MERSVIVSDGMQPLRVRLQSHDEHGSVWQRELLMLSSVVFLRLSRGQRCGLLGSEGHIPGRSDTDVHDLGTCDDIDGLVGVL